MKRYQAALPGVRRAIEAEAVSRVLSASDSEMRDLSKVATIGPGGEAAMYIKNPDPSMSGLNLQYGDKSRIQIEDEIVSAVRGDDGNIIGYRTFEDPEAYIVPDIEQDVLKRLDIDLDTPVGRLVQLMVTQSPELNDEIADMRSFKNFANINDAYGALPELVRSRASTLGLSDEEVRIIPSQIKTPQQAAGIIELARKALIRSNNKYLSAGPDGRAVMVEGPEKPLPTFDDVLTTIGLHKGSKPELASSMYQGLMAQGSEVNEDRKRNYYYDNGEYFTPPEGVDVGFNYGNENTKLSYLGSGIGGEKGKQQALGPLDEKGRKTKINIVEAVRAAQQSPEVLRRRAEDDIEPELNNPFINTLETGTPPEDLVPLRGPVPQEFWESTLRREGKEVTDMGLKMEERQRNLQYSDPRYIADSEKQLKKLKPGTKKYNDLAKKIDLEKRRRDNILDRAIQDEGKRVSKEDAVRLASEQRALDARFEAEGRRAERDFEDVEVGHLYRLMTQGADTGSGSRSLLRVPADSEFGSGVFPREKPLVIKDDNKKYV